MRASKQIPLVVAITCVVIGGSSVARCAEPEFRYSESLDKLTNATQQQLIVVADDGKSTIELRQTDGKPELQIFINPKKTIFPDVVDTATGGSMSVGVTLRSSQMEKPTTVRCGMNMMDYDFCYFNVGPKSAQKLFSGDFITLQMARTGDVMTFPTGGDDLNAAVSKVVAPADKLAQAAIKDKEGQEKVNEAAASEKERQRELKAKHEKPATEGRQAGAEMASKLGAKAKGLGRSGALARAKAACKKAGYEGGEAEMFVSAFVESLLKTDE